MMKKALGIFTLSLFAAAASAQSVDTNADDFAMQAGVIAGATQACNQNISTFNTRVVDVINVLAKTNSDRQNAMTVYEKALSNAQYAQTRSHPMSCNQVIASFQSLPLMRADFQQTVLPQMAQLGNAGTTNTAPADNTSPDAQINPPPPPPPPNTGMPNNNPPPDMQTPDNSVAVPGNSGADSSVPGNTQTMVMGNG